MLALVVFLVAAVFLAGAFLGAAAVFLVGETLALGAAGLVDFAEAAFFAVAVLALAFFTTPVFFAAVDLLAGALAAGLGFAGALADLESGLFC